MNLINNTRSPALAFYGVDQHEQEFHVVVTRQTYTWDNTGLLVLAEEQDPLCMMDQMVDPSDFMSGVIEESDLCHYKPKCDVLVKGHAYPPSYQKNKNHFIATLKLKTPDKVVYANQINTKYAFVNTSKNVNSLPKGSYIEGTVLIDKALTILSPRYAIQQGISLNGSIHYTIEEKGMCSKVSLNPTSSFGGYCFIEESNKVIQEINESQLIPEEDRDEFKLPQADGRIAYFAQDSHNPAGKGSYPNIYHHAIKPKRFELPQIHNPKQQLSDKHLEQMANNQLDSLVHKELVNGFGVRSKNHPDRLKYAGTLDQDYITGDKSLPKDFDFAIWNSAFPDQQVEEIKGDEWIILTNLCSTDTVAATESDNGDTVLSLYLPDMLAYLVTVPVDEEEIVKQAQIKIDTIVISPDEQKVNIIWRSIIKANEAPKHLMLEVLSQQEKDAILSQHFVQKGEVVRPYEAKTDKGSVL